MTRTRIGTLSAAVLLAAAGLWPCLCPGMAPNKPAASHCGSAAPSGPGLTAAHHACDCTCMAPLPRETTAARVEPAFPTTPLAAWPSFVVRQASHSTVTPIALAEPSRGAPPPILRI